MIQLLIENQIVSTMELNTISTTLCSALLLPFIYFRNPLTITITQELEQLSNNKNKSENSLLLNLSKGISAYESWLEKEEEKASNLIIEQLIDDLKKESKNYYEDYLFNREEYRASCPGGTESINSLYKKRISKSRKARLQSKKVSRFNLFRGSR
jgi:hypothetical protein